MQATTSTRVIAAAAVIVVGGLVLLLARVPSDDAPPVARSDETLAIAVSDTTKAPTEPPALVHDAPAAVKIRELEALSETFRNTTFVIAIRDAGYVCNELLRVYGGIDDSGKWTATCSEMLAYTLGVMANGDLHVEPMMQYFDSPTPAPIGNENPVPVLPPPQPRRGLEPR
ncbi:MAG TPA: hypothetical protein VNA66_05490 [Gammaproteobacteria bacterium]|jgi:hypothetical protein|nr:hypothetical protein [Gammaproteobacteria bacterium]